MTPRSEQLRKINVDLRLTAEDLGFRSRITKLDELEVLDVSTPANFKRALTAYHELAITLGKGKPAAQRTSLLADILRLEAPQRCYEDLAAEARARKAQDDGELDDLDNLDNESDEERASCRCIQRQWQAFTTRSITVSRCPECRDGNHSACEFECGAPDDPEWLAEHDEDAELRRRLGVIGRKIEREASTRE